MRFTVTHPFHPLSGQVLVLVDRRHNAHEERVFYEDADSRLTSLPTRWTSLSAPDPFAVVAQGRACFRPEDLLRIAALIDGLRRTASVKDSDQCVKETTP